MSSGQKGEDSVHVASAEVIPEADNIEGLVDEIDAARINDPADQQDRESEEFAVEFLKRVLRLRGVRIDRDKFLRAELHKRGFPLADIQKALSDNPTAAGIPLDVLDNVAQDSIDFETKKSTALSFAAGLPGGFAMVGTVPTDITQYYVHAFRVIQKTAYVYGWQSFLDDTEDIDDETLGRLATFLGVMMGVGGASASLKSFTVQVARPAIQKKIASTALTKTSWYLPMKQTLRVVGVHVTKQSFAKTVTKVVPVVGGVLSGGLTFVSLKVQSKRLKSHLRELPPPNVDAAEYLAALRRADATETDEADSPSLGNGEVPDKARAVTAVEDTVSTVRRGVVGTTENVASFLRRKRGRSAEDALSGFPDSKEIEEESADSD